VGTSLWSQPQPHGATPETQTFLTCATSFSQAHHFPSRTGHPNSVGSNQKTILIHAVLPAYTFYFPKSSTANRIDIGAADSRPSAVTAPRPSSCPPLALANAWSIRTSSRESATQMLCLRRRTRRSCSTSPTQASPAGSTQRRASRLAWPGSSRSTSSLMASLVCPWTWWACPASLTVMSDVRVLNRGGIARPG
jgi:hypothetical protein